MSGPTKKASDAPRYELWRTNVNLRGLGAGTEIEIDPEDPRWWGDIAGGYISPVYPPPAREQIDPLPVSAPSEMVEKPEDHDDDGWEHNRHDVLNEDLAE